MNDSLLLTNSDIRRSHGAAVGKTVLMNADGKRRTCFLYDSAPFFQIRCEAFYKKYERPGKKMPENDREWLFCYCI